MNRRALSAAAAVGVMAGVGFFALLDTGSGIDLTAFTLTDTVNVTGAAGVAVCELTMTDADGVAVAGCVLKSPLGRKTSCISFAPSSGVPTSGTWTCSAPLEADTEDGAWKVEYLFANDTLGNRAKWTYATMLGTWTDPELTVAVTSTNQDVTPPTISAFTALPALVDPGDPVTCTVTADGTGTAVRDVGCTFTSATEASLTCVGPSPSCDLAVPVGADAGAVWTEKSHVAVDSASNRAIGSTGVTFGTNAPGGGLPAAPGWPNGPADTCTRDVLIGAACYCDGVEYSTGYCCTDGGYSFSACTTANVYVLPSGTGAQNGSDWANALAGLPGTLARGTTYWLGAGNYGAYSFNDAASGSLGITIIKAITTNHGTNTGWLDTYDTDGPAEFSQSSITTDRWTFHGQKINGIRFQAVANNGSVLTTSVSNLAMHRVEIDGQATFGAGPAMTGGACKGILMDGTHSDLVFDQMEIHSVGDDNMELGSGSNAFTRLRILNSKLHNALGCGVDASCSGACNNGHADGIELGGCTDCEVSGTMIYDIASVGSGTSGFFSSNFNPGNLNNFLFENNIIYTPGSTITPIGFAAYINDTSGGSYNNNIFWGLDQGTFGGVAFCGNTSGIVMRNNIIQSINFSFCADPYTPANHDLDFNQFAINPTSEGYTPKPNDQVGNPLFTAIPMSPTRNEHSPEDLLLSEFEPTASSPTLDQGTTAGPTYTIEGVTRPVGAAYDMGPFDDVAGAGGAGGASGCAGVNEPPVELTTTGQNWVASAPQSSAANQLVFETYARTTALDALVNVSDGVPTTWGDNAVTARFNPSGFFDAMDGLGYGCGNGDGDSGDAACSVPYNFNTWYKFTLTIDLIAGTYDVDVGECDQAQSSIIAGASFRNGAPATAFDEYSVWALSGTIDLDTPSWTPSGAPPLTSTIYPLQVSGNGRYLVQKDGTTPFLIHGEAAWSAMGELTNPTEMTTYLNDAEAKGFNTVLVNAPEAWFTTHATRYHNANGDSPFAGAYGDFTNLNEAYWTYADFFISTANSKDILVILAPMYGGYNNDQGWINEIGSTGEAATYGAWVASHYDTYPNVMFAYFNEAGCETPPGSSTFGSYTDALGEAIDSGMTVNRLGLAHRCEGLTGDGQNMSLAADPWWDIRAVYNLSSPFETATYTETEYGNTPTAPVMVFEPAYEDDLNNATPLDVRLAAYHGLLSGALAGHLYGASEIWDFNSNSPTPAWDSSPSLNRAGRLDMAHLWTIFSGVEWWRLVPVDSADSTIITGGRGTFGTDSWVSASVAGDQSFMIAYGSTGAAFTVNTLAALGSGTHNWETINPATGVQISSGTDVTNAAGQSRCSGADCVFIATATVPAASRGPTGQWPPGFQAYNTAADIVTNGTQAAVNAALNDPLCTDGDGCVIEHAGALTTIGGAMDSRGGTGPIVIRPPIGQRADFFVTTSYGPTESAMWLDNILIAGYKSAGGLFVTEGANNSGFAWIEGTGTGASIECYANSGNATCLFYEIVQREYFHGYDEFDRNYVTCSGGGSSNATIVGSILAGSDSPPAGCNPFGFDPHADTLQAESPCNSVTLRDSLVYGSWDKALQGYGFTTVDNIYLVSPQHVPAVWDGDDAPFTWLGTCGPGNNTYTTDLPASVSNSTILGLVYTDPTKYITCSNSILYDNNNTCIDGGGNTIAPTIPQPDMAMPSHATLDIIWSP